jgi:hypothetical protein
MSDAYVWGRISPLPWLNQLAVSVFGTKGLAKIQSATFRADFLARNLLGTQDRPARWRAF